MSDEHYTAPENNGFAEKHGLYSDREKLFQRLSMDEQRLVVNIGTDLLEKFNDDVGAYERNAIRNIALDQVKRIRANEHILAEDLITDGGETADRTNKAYSRLVRDTTSELEKLGLLDEGPAKQSAEAQAGWMEQISNATDASDE